MKEDPLGSLMMHLTGLIEFLEPWTDVIDDTMAATIRIVRSTPPCNRWECVQAHLIIEQDSLPRQVVCLISHFDWRYSEQGWVHRALSTDNFQNVRSLLRAAELHIMCQTVTCNVHARGLPFAMVDFEEIGNAWGFVIYISRPPITDPHSDVNSLMQSAPVSHGLEFPPHAGEGRCFDFDPLAPTFILNQADIWGLPEDIHDLHDVWRTGAQALENEAPVAHFLVWFLCPGGGLRRCLRPRRVTLSDDFTDWRERLIFAWREHIFETVPVEIHVIAPTPHPLEMGITAHILLTQLIPDHESCVLLGISDNAINDAQPFRVALTVQDPANMHTFLGVAGYLFEQATFALQYQQMPIAPGQLTPTRTGNYFELQVHRTMLPAHWTPPITPDVPGAEGMGLLQTKATLLKSATCERLTHGQVAHTHGPQVEHSGIDFSSSQPVTLLLDETLTTAIEILSGAPEAQLPSFIEVPVAFEERHIEQELSAFGHDCKAYTFGSHRKAFCIPRRHFPSQPSWHVLFAHVDPCVVTGTFVHTFLAKWDEIQLMKVLHQLGFEKAFILAIEPKDQAFTLVTFGESHGSLAYVEKLRPSRPWPPRQKRSSFGALFKPPDTWTPDCLLKLGLGEHDISAFFKPQADVLCSSFEGIDLPHVTVNALAALDTACNLDALDRLIIYVDGSSQPNQKHLPPLRVDAEGIPDAWAFLVIGEKYVSNDYSTFHLLGWHAQQVRYDPASPNFAGALKVNSHIAEREGLFFAALWRATLNCNLPTVFRSDSKLTCGQATGSIGAAEIDLSYSLLRGIFQFLETAMDTNDLIVEHIYGHNNDPWNEAVDTLAKNEAQRSYFLPRIEVDLTKWGAVIPFLWMIVGERFGCPTFCGEGFDVHAPDRPDCLIPGDQLAPADTPLSAAVASSVSSIDFRISFASGNVSTLGVGARGLAGKLDYLKDQFKSFHLNFLGVQEARTKEGTLSAQDILRFCSGADSKNLGVELWCNLAQPFAFGNNQPHFFQASDFVVLHRDPRRLLVVVQNALWHAHILVGHAPHSGYALAERATWWDETAAIVDSHNVEQRPLFVLIDANASPGPCDHHVVLGPGYSASNSTTLWRQFLTDHELCLPATSALHVGPHHTWTAPDGIDKHFIDFVAIPQKFLSSCTWTQTLEQFDLNPLHEDHLAVGLELAWHATDLATSPCSLTKAWSCNRSAIAQASLAEPLSLPHDLRWHTDIEQHVESLNSLFRSALTKHCQKHPLKPKKAFLSDELWHLRKRKLQLRRRLRLTQRTTSLESVARLFQSWRSQACGQVEHLPELVAGSLSFEVSLRCSEVLRAAELWATCRTLKYKLSTAKKEILAAKINELSHLNSASDILCTLKPFVGSSNALKKGPKPLPLVHNEDGQPCGSTAEALDRWISFFMCMEGGSRVDQSNQRAMWINNLQEFATDNLEVDVQEVPSLVELEMAFRRVKKGKACGPDFLPSELFHYFPTVIAKQCYATLLKVALQGQECLLHKGGTLVPLWKGKDDKSSCSSFRSILLSSHFGKTLHRALRLKQAHIYETYMHAQQLGGRRRTPLTLGTHLARAFMRFHKSEGRPTALLFLDLMEAFYRVVRPLALSGSLDDEVLGAMAARLKLDHDTLEELQNLLKQPGAIEEAGLPAHSQRALRAIHADTHFALRGQNDCCRTTLGSRPGDAFADVVFGYLWAKILHNLQACLQEHGLCEFVNDEHGPNWFGQVPPLAAPQQPFLGPCWCDDLCICMSASTLHALSHKAAVTSSVLLDLCKVHGMTPNLNKGKTELMFSMRGRGQRAFRRCWFGPQAPRLFPILGETGFYQIPLVGAYRHLGGTLHHSGDLKCEIRRRIGIAHQTFSEHRRLLFQNKAISLRKRVELFRCLVLSKMLYGTDSWVINDQKTKSTLHAAIMKLYKRLLGAKHEDKLSDDSILTATGLSSPSELLRISRLRYVRTLFAAADVVSWGLFNIDSEWNALIEDDFIWMYNQLRNSSPLKDPKQHFAQWLDVIRHQPGYWKRLTSRAMKHAIGQRDKNFKVLQAHQDIFALLKDHGHYVPLQIAQKNAALEVFGCMQCGIACRSKAGEGAHMFRTHGQIHPVRQLFQTTQCAICLTEYFTFDKLKMHLIRNEGCRRKWHGLRAFTAPMPGLGSLADEALHQQEDGLLPPLRAEGPHRDSSAGQRFRFV